jgi:hypothetical protein
MKIAHRFIGRFRLDVKPESVKRTIEQTCTYGFASKVRSDLEELAMLGSAGALARNKREA